MGVLKQVGTERAFQLSSRCLIGRHAACEIAIDDPRISSEHASLHWMGDHWEFRDLGSRNGTSVGGVRLPSGGRAELAEGATIALADVAFVLGDASAPLASARHLASGLQRSADHRLLVLPSDEQPKVSLFEDEAGRWVAESEDTRRVVVDREILTIDGESWSLSLPMSHVGTCDVFVAGPTLETIHLRFAVSRDEEHVAVTLVHGGREVRVAPRTYHYLLVTLARARLAERDAAAEEQGWIDRDTLCRMLATEASKLNLDVFRVRKQFAAMGVVGAAGIIARRPESATLRIGTARVDVGPL